MSQLPCNRVKNPFGNAVSSVTAIGTRGLVYFLQNVKLVFLVHICLHISNWNFTA